METKISYELYRNSRITLDFFMFLPQTLYREKSSTYVLRYNPVLMIRHNTQSKENFMAASFKITPRNLHYVMEFFNNAVKWFYDKDKVDLFLVGDDGKLIFNGAYKDLVEQVGPGRFDSMVMRAVPGVIENNEETSEGIYLSINRSEFVSPIYFSELTEICSILECFNFNTMGSTVLALLDNAISRNAVVTDPLLWNLSGSGKVELEQGDRKTPFD